MCLTRATLGYASGGSRSDGYYRGCSSVLKVCLSEISALRTDTNTRQVCREVVSSGDLQYTAHTTGI